jgi:hypothetical protein
MGAFTKRWLINKRRTRRHKIDLLRKRYLAADSEAQRNAILKKAQLVSPQMTVEEFLSTIKKESSSAEKPGSKARTTA